MIGEMVESGLLLEELKRGESPMLLVLYAEWCSVCRRVLEDVLPSMEEKYGEHVSFYGIPVEAHDGGAINKELCDHFRADGHPLVLTVKDGKVVRRNICWGTKSEQAGDVENMLDQLIGLSA